MKLLTVSFLAFFFPIFILLAQEPAFEIEKFGDNNDIFIANSPQLFNCCGDYYTEVSVLLRKSGLFSFLGYTKDGILKNEKQVEWVSLIPDVRYLEVEKTFCWNDSIFTLVSNLDMTGRKKGLYLLSHHKGDHILEKYRTIISLTDVSTSFIAHNYKFKISYSPDSSKILISCVVDRSNKIEETVLAQVWSMGFQQLLWEKETKIPFDENNSIMETAHLDNDGNVYFIFNDDKTTFGRMNIVNKYHFIRLRNFGEKMDYNIVDLGEKGGNDMHLIFDENNNMTAFAYYYEQKELSGLLVLNYPLQEGKPQKVEFHSFIKEVTIDAPFQNLINTSMMMAKYKLNYFIQDCILEKNGDMTLIAENRFIQYHSNMEYNGRDGFTHSPTYNSMPDGFSSLFYDIIVTRITKEGKIIWTKRIPKKQDGDEKISFFNCASYRYIKRGDDLLIFYTDNIENDLNSEKIKDMPFLAEKGKSVFAMVTISANGDMKRQVLKQEDGVYIMFHKIKLVSPDEIQFGVTKTYEKFALGKVVWK